MIRKRMMRTAAHAMLSLLLAVSAFVALLPASKASAANTVYYIDSVNGNDGNAGTSPGAAWKSIGKVNAKTNYQPGDQILFKAGGIWTGSIMLKNSGSAGNPIVIGQYGDGPKPVINANAAYAAINLENIQYITLEDLELTNFKASDPDDYLTGYYRRSGIWIKAFHNGPMKDITIRNMDIHDVTGMSVSGETSVTTTDGKDKNVNKNANAAIQIDGWQWETDKPIAYYDGLVVENNYIHDVSTIGININASSTDKNFFNKNVVVHGNTIMNNGADGITIGASAGPLIEYNVSLDAGGYGHGYQWIVGMWTWRSNGSTFQYNEVGRVHTDGVQSEADSAAFDTDLSSTGNHVYQYNYTHDNEGGFFMEMGQLKDGINILRYNISQNDKRNGWSGNTMNLAGDPSLFYNNVFYNDLGNGFQIRNNSNATFVNNIFDVAGNGSTVYPDGPKFYYNAFDGQPAPAQGIGSVIGDPGFVDPGQGADGIGTVDGYRLSAGSPLIGAGMAVDDNGGRDFWNNPLYTGSPDIGAFEDPASAVADTTPPAAPTDVAVSEMTDESMKLTWQAAEGGVPLGADIYDADTDTLVGSVMVANEYMVKGLTPGTDYRFYVVAKDRSGNASAPSAEASGTTLTSVTVDNKDAAVSSGWTAATGGGAYENDYVKAPAGSGARSVTWTPDLPVGGYYSVYAYIPDGSDSRAGNASYTVTGAGGSATYSVDQRPKGIGWKLLGIHRFDAGTSGSVTLTDKAGGEVAADAVKFIDNEDLDLGDIESISIETDSMQLRLQETTGLSVYGTDALGRVVNLTADGAAVELISDDPDIADFVNGQIVGKADGTTFVSARFTYNGVTMTSNKAEIVVGEAFAVKPAVFADANGAAVTSPVPGVITASVAVINSTDIHRRATVTVALYSQAGLVSQTSKEAVIQKYGNATISVPVTIPDDADGYYVKVFVWDSLTFKRPLAEPTVLD